MENPPTLLKYLLTKRHWQKYETFCREYERVAQELDPQLQRTFPSQAQYYRWISGNLRTGQPYPDACRVLEAMFPEWSAERLLQSCPIELLDSHDTRDEEVKRLFNLVDSRLYSSNVTSPDWGPLSFEELEAHRFPSSIAQIPSALSEHDTAKSDSVTNVIARRLITLQQTLRLSQRETHQLGALTGNIIDLDLSVTIDIAKDGWARVEYSHEILNMTNNPIARINRELWFEHTREPALVIQPVQEGRYKTTIHRTHDTQNLAKFACQLSPAVQPGESRVFKFWCEGGRFVSDHYWRQAFPRFVRRFTLTLRHGGVKPLFECSAIEELSDGSERSATEQLVWDYEGDNVLIVLTRDYLWPNQAVTLRWEVNHDTSA